MNIFTANFKRVLTSKLFYFSILGVTLICLFGAYTDGTPMVIQCFMNTLLISSYRNLIVFLAALPFSAAFCIEWNSRSTYYIVKRTSLKQYLLSHITTQFLSAFMIGAAGAMHVSTAHVMSTAITNDVGWTGVIVAWLSKLNPAVIFVVSILITVLQYGCQVANAEFAAIDTNFANLLQGIILFSVLVADFLIRFKIIRNKAKAENGKESE